MADKVISLDSVKALWNSQVHDPEKWDHNKKLLRAVGMFAGAVVLMRQWGDMMAI